MLIKYNMSMIGYAIGGDPENRRAYLSRGHEADLLTADPDLSIIDKRKDFYREVEYARKKI